MAIGVNVMSSVGGAHAFTAAYAPQQHPANRHYVIQQLANVSQNMMADLGHMGQALFMKAQEVFEQYDGHDVMQQARSAMRELAAVNGADVIYEMYELNHLQQAQPMMQNYIMANPVMAEMYQRQRCDGYSGSYVDHYEQFGVYENPYYIKATTGVLMEPNENHPEGTTWVVDNYFTDVEADHLSIDEQNAIQMTWLTVEQQVKWGNDPTDNLGGDL